MKHAVIAGLLASCAVIVGACSEAAEVEPRPDLPVVVAPDAGDATVRESDAAPDAPPLPTSCSAPLVDPACTTTKPPPTSAEAITNFVKDGAVPLRCAAGNDAAVWDVRSLVDLYGNQKMFMIGEVHGSNEIGIVSSVLLEQLGKKDLVNVVGFEMPMDMERQFQRYVDTGKDTPTEQYLAADAPNFFGVLLTKTARELTKNGHPIRIVPMDVPVDPQSAADEIRAVATKLTAQKSSVLATLAASASNPPSPSDIAKTNAYFDHIIADKTTICSELSAADCDRLIAMTHAFWTSMLSQVLDLDDDLTLWFDRREELIYYNMHAKMMAPTDRMFLHMGAAHTNKHSASAGSRMAKEYPLTKGQVFSVAPAWGDGSVIFYGQDTDLPGEPATITTALTQAPNHPLFVSTTRPSAACESNPLGQEGYQPGGTKRSELYDGYIHYGKLTSMKRPQDTILSRATPAAAATESKHDHVRALVAFRARIEQNERAAIAAGAVKRTNTLRR